jgi:hypothetical protein
MRVRKLFTVRTKSRPHDSGFSAAVLLGSNDGKYCGEVVEISQPLLPIGKKTPRRAARGTDQPRVPIGEFFYGHAPGPLF